MTRNHCTPPFLELAPISNYTRFETLILEMNSNSIFFFFEISNGIPYHLYLAPGLPALTEST